ncbi:MAG TPA: gluconate 2-dehydrogenase subunit 3 family protein [Opitutaceae bacterium]|nr:gluconate 2-dehydrogenase subunit 3 family protein [Opitutaceae bacterium]
MNRREAVRRIALLLGGAMVGSEVILGGQPMPDKKAAGFTDADRALLDEVGETILPATDIPGAKAVHIGAFMAMMVTDCYTDREHAVFREGLRLIDEACRAKAGKSFMESTPAERTDVANLLEKEQRAQYAGKAAGEPPHYFRMMKELTVLGYFSSEIGCTRAVRYIEVPGAYHADIPYAKGERAWF